MVTTSPSPVKEEKRAGSAERERGFRVVVVSSHGFAVVDPCMAEEREPEEKCEAQPPPCLCPAEKQLHYCRKTPWSSENRNCRY
ncbi:hypothetical protein PIB30_033261 [Stylosanthes scabra]|uniref:Uncharacterized protein n=1 Tax=Stylosanthes scabra TaxID=79078 RepID=A0ABU6YCP2_9FABA|nr:hypothetical protein [Stylosanthes scabra]